MKKLEINKIDNYVYELKDIYNKIYHFNIEFYNLEKKVKVGDYIYMNEKLLQEEYCMLNFDVLDNKFGREIKINEDEDIIVLQIDNEKIYLKRIYG